MDINFTSGIGQHHTNEPGKPNRKPYLAIGFSEIQALVDNPQQVDKAQAQWIIPSTHPSRTFKEQEAHGEYWLLWADFDKNPPALKDIGDLIYPKIDHCDFELYNSRGATVDNQKSRLLIPLNKPLLFADWNLAQEVLNDKLEALGIIPDRSSERAAQLCYLPNRGGLYDCDYARNKEYFNPMRFWAQEIATKREKLESDRLALLEAQRSTMAKREALKLPSNDNRTLSKAEAFEELKNAFNEVYTCQDWLLQAGYSQHGLSFCHPASGSGSYSASISIETGRVNALSPNDPLFSNGKGAHDAFSVYATLFHGGDTSAAAVCAGDTLLTIGSVSWNKAKQLEWAKAQSKDDTGKPKAEQAKAEGDNKPFDLTKYSLMGQSEAMKKQMINDVFVLQDLAILGQATVFYAQFNTGKTLLVLWLLIDSIKAGRIEGKNVFYVNADDTFNGTYTKNIIAETYGFHMLMPNQNGFDPDNFTKDLKQMIDGESARGKIIILDTLKKFTELMDKRQGTSFMKIARQFVQCGGTLIMLAHSNKHKSLDGKVVYGGTNDVPSDSDCVFTIDTVSDDGRTKQVLFEHIKSRGNVCREKAFSYLLEADTYGELLESVVMADDKATNKAKKEKGIRDRYTKDEDAINAIIEAIESGNTLKTNLIDSAHRDSGISKARINKVLSDYTGLDITKGNLWFIETGNKGAKVYSRLESLNPVRSLVTGYNHAKHG